MSCVPRQSTRVSLERLSLSAADDRKGIVQLAGPENQRVQHSDVDVLNLLLPDEVRRLADVVFRTA